MLRAVRLAKAKMNRICLYRNGRELGLRVAVLAMVTAWTLGCAFSVTAYAQAPPVAQPAHPSVTAGAPTTAGQVNSQATGTISGTVVDGAGAVAVGARVQLKAAGQSQEVSSGDNGQFSFVNVPPGPFDLTITAPDFKTQTVSGVLQPGTADVVPEIELRIARATTNVEVGRRSEEVAQIQVKHEEQQRVLGIVPNFYVSYASHPAPLTPSQKLQLAWKSLSDPITLLAVGSLAGIQQAADDYPGFGQGAAGYGKRFGAAYATHFSTTFLDRALLPTLFKQDPRYFYQGYGSTGSRIRHALAYAVIRRGDDGRSQPNYSGILGSFAAGGISYFYYPDSDHSPGLLVQNSMVAIAVQGAYGLFQEFVLRKFTSHSKSDPTHP